MTDLLLAWLPALLILAVWIFAMRRSRKGYDKHVADVSAINREILEMNRQNVRVLEEIKALLQDRKT